MSGKRAKRFRAAAKPANGPAQSSLAKSTVLFATPIALLVAVTIGYFTLFHDQPARHTITSDIPSAKVVRRAQTFDDLLKIPAAKLGEVDIAEMNLLCATGLPGAEKLDIDHALATLDQWAKRVAFETDRHLYRVTDSRYADAYHRSEAYFRAYFLLQVLAQDLGVKYDMTAVGNFSYKDSRVAFLHGMIPMSGQTFADTPGGTCASMPVLYVAVGRRLGYPLKLVTTKGHVFVRWEGKDSLNPAWRERFNLDGSGNGCARYEDEYFKAWPYKLTDQEIQANRYLASLSPAEDLAEFLASRGHCALDNGQAAFAARCYENAYGYDPSRLCYRKWLADAAGQSGYRPTSPALASLLAMRKRPANARPVVDDGFIMPSQLAAMSGQGEIPLIRVGQWQPQASAPGSPQPPLPYSPRTPSVGAPQPGPANLYQPYQPPIAGQQSSNRP